MGTVIISERTCKDPITLIGEQSGVCYGSDITDRKKNYKRGVHNLKSGHGRTWEFPDVYMTIDGYSARVIREFYTHIGGSPTRLQESTRYVNFAKGFEYITPPSISKDLDATDRWVQMMEHISKTLSELNEEYNIPHEDLANGLPLGMVTKIQVKINLRTLIDMSHQRMCKCAYWEFRNLFQDICDALTLYSTEWGCLVMNHFVPKCEVTGYCNEGKRSCGRKPLKEENK